MAKIGFLTFLALITVVFPTIAQTQEQEIDSIQTAPTFVVGDKWVYNNYESLNDAKQGHNPGVDTTRIVREINDKGILVSNPEGTRQYLYNKDFNMLEAHSKERDTFYKPFWPAYKYPMRVGDKYKVEFSNNRNDGHDNDYKATIRVVGWETVTVPAGTFKALKVEMTGYWTHPNPAQVSEKWTSNFRGISWFAPEVKMRSVLYLWESWWGTRGGSRERYESLKLYDLKK
ncbi:MAG: hypothetical protein COS10_09420 [Nitrospirae bacterium CG01_land_8_20_14_3_00_44_22]|nr:MAG: hypothetical protein COS10_09420 [Nitrospirae bacterium CG01_land_8_20_14_3_00_44_22]